MAIEVIEANDFQGDALDKINDNFQELQESAGKMNIPVHYLPSTSPNAPEYRLIKPDGTPSPTSNAVEFVATGSLTIPHFAGLDFLSDFAIDFWAFLDSSGVNDFIITKIPTGASNIFRVVQKAGGLRIQTGGNTDVAANIDAWNHIVLTYDADAGSLDVYIDAILQTSIGIIFASNLNDWTLGARFAPAASAWTGLVDELKLIGAYYSQSDVNASYNSGSGLSGTAGTPNLINGFHFNNDLDDYSANDNDATENGITGFSSGKVGDPLGGTGIFAYVFKDGENIEMPFIINVPDGFEGTICNLNAKVYIIDDISGDLDFTIYWTWTNNDELMATPTKDDKSYAIDSSQVSKIVTTELNPVEMTKVSPEPNGTIAGLFRRNGITDTYNGDVAILSLCAQFQYN